MNAYSIARQWVRGGCRESDHITNYNKVDLELPKGIICIKAKNLNRWYIYDISRCCAFLTMENPKAKLLFTSNDIREIRKQAKKINKEKR